MLNDEHGNTLRTIFDDTENKKETVPNKTLRSQEKWEPKTAQCSAKLEIMAVLPTSCKSISLNGCGISQLDITSYGTRTFPKLEISGVEKVSVDRNTTIDEMVFCPVSTKLNKETVWTEKIEKDTLTSDGKVGVLRFGSNKLTHVSLSGNQTIEDIDISGCGDITHIDLENSAVKGKTLTMSAKTLITARFFNLGENHLRSTGICRKRAGMYIASCLASDGQYKPGFDSSKGIFTGAERLEFFRTLAPITLTGNTLDFTLARWLQVFECQKLSTGDGSEKINVIGHGNGLKAFKSSHADVDILIFSKHSGSFLGLSAVIVGGSTLQEVQNLPYSTHIFNSIGCEKGCCFDLGESPADISVLRGQMEVCSVRVLDDVTSLDISGGLGFLDISGRAISRVEVHNLSPHVCAECTAKTGPGGAIYSGTKDAAAPASAKITLEGHAFTDPHRRIFDALRAIEANRILHGIIKNYANSTLGTRDELRSTNSWVTKQLVAATDIKAAMGITEPKAPPAPPKAKPAAKPAEKKK